LCNGWEHGGGDLSSKLPARNSTFLMRLNKKQPERGRHAAQPLTSFVCAVSGKLSVSDRGDYHVVVRVYRPCDGRRNTQRRNAHGGGTHAGEEHTQRRGTHREEEHRGETHSEGEHTHMHTQGVLLGKRAF